MENHSHPEIIQMQVQMAELIKKVERHEVILVTGTDDALSLPEIVRNLSLTVENYIKHKEKEESSRAALWSKFGWIVVAALVPAVLIFLGQAIVFWVRFYPVLISTPIP